LAFPGLLRAADEPNSSASELKKVQWVKGPGRAEMKDTAEITLAEGYRFANANDTRRILEAFGNLTSGTELGLVAPTSMVWFVVFEFSESGFVKDDDKDKLDADAMLKTIGRGVERSNEERKRRGFPSMKVIGWEQPPHYDTETHNLEWALKFESEGSLVVNYNTRLLGRRGVMEVQLVVDPDKLSTSLPEFKQLLRGFQFKTGEKYAEYRQGDKLATYGLAALVTGGAVAVAAKTGLLTAAILFFKKFAKLLVVAVLAAAGWIKRLVTGRRPPSES
jgi:uncharacterized membrane-anchored protein